MPSLDSSSLKRKSDAELSSRSKSKKIKSVKTPQRSNGPSKSNGFARNKTNGNLGVHNAVETTPSSATKHLTQQAPIATPKSDSPLTQSNHERPVERLDASKLRKSESAKKHRKRHSKRRRDTVVTSRIPRATRVEDEPHGDEAWPEDEEHDVALAFHTTHETMTSILRAHTQESQQPWKLSTSNTGRFSDSAPVLSADEKYLFASTESAVNVYDTETSLLHKVVPDVTDSLSSFCLSALDSRFLYITTANTIDLWDWTTSTQVGCLTANFSSENAVCVKADYDVNEDLLFTISFAGKWGISVHRFAPVDDEPYKGSFPIVSAENQITDFSVLFGGAVLILEGLSSVMVGLLRSTASKNFESWEYDWQEILCDEAPVSLKVRSGPRADRIVDSVADLAIGGARGSIYLYRNFLQSLFGADARKSVVPQRLHWHRESVPALAWSKDGNYIISGGSETVLVLWQLDTGQQQYLPHLEAPIRSISVSATGSSYVVGLNDNSILVLSTSELEPTAMITSLQSLSDSTDAAVSKEAVTTDAFSSVRNIQPERTVRACMRGGAFNDMMLAVPSSQSASSLSTAVPSSPYLQRFHMGDERHLSRQALARTNATTVNRGPEGLEIPTPDVKHMAVSADGLWLSTVDEWGPPIEDVQDMEDSASQLESGMARHRDVIMRFWKWNDEQQQWELVSRVESPHPLSRQPSAGRVLAMVAHPFETKFATVGEDGVLCQWSLKSRLPSGRVIRGPSPKAKETWWSASMSTELPRTHIEDPSRAVAPHRATASFSEDGSCIAVNQSFANRSPRENNVVHFIDTSTGEIAQSRDDLFTDLITKSSDLPADQVAALGILDRYLILVGKRVAVTWDLPSMQLNRAVPLYPQFPRLDALALTDPEELYRRTGITTPEADVPLPKLAINHRTKTFAIAAHKILWDPANGDVPLLTGAHARNPLRTHTSVVSVFSATSRRKEPLFQTTVPRLVMSLLSADGQTPALDVQQKSYRKPGFVLIDARANLRHLTPTGALPVSEEHRDGTNVGGGDEIVEPMEGVTNAVDEDDEAGDGLQGEENGAAAVELEAADRAVVPQQSLAAVFDHPPHMMPSMIDMFNDVVKLYAPKSAVA